MKNEWKSFLLKAKDDPRIGPTHISLYMAILLQQDNSKTTGCFPIDRRGLMAASRILCGKTYYKCMRELSQYKYITYRPENNPGKRTKVAIPGTPST